MMISTFQVLIKYKNEKLNKSVFTQYFENLFRTKDTATASRLFGF